jgi:hypothetical protein
MESMTRRELLSKSTVLLLLVPVAACGSSSSGTPDSDAGVILPDEDAATCDGVFSIGTVDDNHTHSLCVPTTDLKTPPAGGSTYTTSNTDGHTHPVTLTAAQLASIESGTTVTVTTGGTSPYPHTFTILKA